MWGENLYLWEWWQAEQQNKIGYAEEEVAFKCSNPPRETQRSTTARKHKSSERQCSGIMKHFSLEVRFCKRERSKEVGACNSLYAGCFFEWHVLWQISEVLPHVHLTLVCTCFLQLVKYNYEEENSFQSLEISKHNSWFLLTVSTLELYSTLLFPPQQSLIRIQSLPLLQKLKINTGTYFWVFLLQMMRLTFRIVAQGKKPGEPGTVLGSNTTNRFLFSSCNHVRPQFTKGPNHNKTRAPGSRISAGPGSTGWNCPTLNMGECLAITRESGRSQAWPGKLQINLWDLQHVKRAQTGATGGELSRRSMSNKTRLIRALINHTVKA